MKVTTNPQDGVTACELETSDRNKLAAAKTVLEKIGFHYRDTRFGGDLTDNASLIAEILEDGIEAASKKPAPPADKERDTPAK